jgi:hypothetical protein
MHRYGATYLHPDADLHMDFPAVFTNALGEGYAASDTSTTFLHAALCAYHLDDDVVREGLLLLGALAEKPKFCMWMVNRRDHLTALCAVAQGTAELQLAGVHRGHLVGVLETLVFRAVADDENIDAPHVAAAVLPMLLADVARCKQQPASSCSYAAVISAVEAQRGMYGRLRTPDVIREVTERCATLLTATVDLVVSDAAGIHDHARHKPLLSAIMKMLEAVVTGCCTFLPNAAHAWLISSSVRLVGAATAVLADSRQAVAGLSAELQSAEEDERVALLCDAGQLILSAATWGLIDLCFAEDFSFSPASAAATAFGATPAEHDNNGAVSDLCVHGLLSLLPLADAQLLAIPAVSQVIFSLLRKVAGEHTAAFLTTAPEQLQALLMATDHAMRSTDPATARDGFSVIEAIAKFCARHADAAAANAQLLAAFTAACVTAVATASVDAQTISALSNAVFALGTVGGADAIGKAWMAIQPPPPPAVTTAFAAAVSSAPFDLNRRNDRYVFAAALSAVVAVAHGASML